MAEAYNRLKPLPAHGESKPFDAFLERKNLSIQGLLRLGARLKGATTIAYPYSQGLKYRDIVTDKKWSHTGSVFEALKIVPAGEPEPAGVIIAEGETDAARLTAFYPELDVAVLPAGAKHFTPAMASQLDRYGLVLIGTDRDTAGTLGADNIQTHLPKAVHFPPPEGYVDWCEVPHVGPIPGLPVAPVVRGEVVGKIQFVDTAWELDQDLSPPNMLIDDTLFEGGNVHWLDGDPGSGKTLIALSWARDLMREGHDVIWVDFENGIKMALRRLQAMSTEHEVMVKHFHYTGWPEKLVEHLGALMAHWPGAVVIIDSASKALSAAGIDENSNTEVTAWTMPLVRACKSYGCPIVIIDHIAKGSKSQYARGAGAKSADTDVHWRVEQPVPFSKAQEGVMKLSLKKDREGILAFKHFYAVGGHRGLHFSECEDPGADVEERPEDPSV